MVSQGFQTFVYENCVDRMVLFAGSKLVRSPGNLLLMETLKSLESIMKDKLLTTPFEEQKKKTYLTDVINREKKTNTTRAKLELKYNAAVKAKESEVEFQYQPANSPFCLSHSFYRASWENLSN